MATLNAIDDVLRAHQATLSGLCSLGQWIEYLHNGGDPGIAARGLLARLDGLELDRLDQAVARARDRAREVLA